MRIMQTTLIASLALAVASCASMPSTPAEIPGDSPTRDFPTTSPEIRDSAYVAVGRASEVPTGYGLYTALLARKPDAKAVQVLSEIFSTAGRAEDAAIARENLNLITIPVHNDDVDAAASVLIDARKEPKNAATEIMQSHYDFDQAALLMSSVCRSDRDPDVVKVCGSTAPDGPLLVTSQTPLDGGSTVGERLLIVNLSTTPPGALPEVLAAYRQQILREDYADRVEMDGWRLWALNHVLDAANLLPGIAKAYAESL